MKKKFRVNYRYSDNYYKSLCCGDCGHFDILAENDKIAVLLAKESIKKIDYGFHVEFEEDDDEVFVWRWSTTEFVRRYGWFTVEVID